MIKIHSPLSANMTWHLNRQGVLLALENGVPKACFIFNTWSTTEFDQFDMQSSKDWEFKLIGPQDFLTKASEHLSLRKLKVIKEIERSGSFDVVYDHDQKKLKLSLSQESPSEVLVAAPVSVDKNVSDKVKVLIVDDSSTVRTLLQNILQGDPQIEVIGSLDLPSKVDPFIQKNKPDVITMDIHMPEMDGVQLLKQILPKYRIPTIMISSLSEEDGPYVFDALEIGAFDYIKKPSFNEINQVGAFLIERVKLAGKLGARRSSRTTPAPEDKRQTQTVPDGQPWANGKNIILIGSSTGGTEALKNLFYQLPDSIPPVIVVQHIPAVFSKALADRLNTFYKFEVKEAADGDLVKPNQVLIAPGGKQMGIKQRGAEMRVYVTEDEPVNRHKPSVDYLFDSAAKMKDAKNAIGVILTGMGSDGARGLKNLRDLGAYTIGQDEESCVVYGMPKAAYEAGAVMQVTPLSKIGRTIGQYINAPAKKKAG